MSAGCDVMLICNDREAVHEVLAASPEITAEPASSARVVRMRARPGAISDLSGNEQWREAVARVERLRATPDFSLTEGRA